MTSLPPSLHCSLAAACPKAEQFRNELANGLKNLPFCGNDTTVGLENEFQVAVEGCKTEVDLAITLVESNYYKNLQARAGRGDLTPHQLAELNSFLDEEKTANWENSWVRFPLCCLGEYAASLLRHDLLADKNDPQSHKRGDIDQFLFRKEGEPWVRVPVSYLLKISLAQAIGSWQPPDHHSTSQLKKIGERLMEHLISDNSSPEICSFSLSQGNNGELPGRETARETSRPLFLFATAHPTRPTLRSASRKMARSAACTWPPTPLRRQKKLNDLISDQFYRELFLNPCLSGWPKGESKKDYMGLCHQTLSRSQLNTIAKLKEAGHNNQ